MFIHCRKSWRNISSPSDISKLFHEHSTQIFLKNLLRSINWRLSRSTSNFLEFPHSVILYVYEERFRDSLGRLSAGLFLPSPGFNNMCDFSFVVNRLLIRRIMNWISSHKTFFDRRGKPCNIPQCILTVYFEKFPSLQLQGSYTPRNISEIGRLLWQCTVPISILIKGFNS